ncbi:MAG: protein-glutamate O-methyltransferase CheR [Spirochaetales bacterium]|nr:protein-glutamate O-methyltransferase CheR [Spirochaetales bacterium]
MLDLSLSEFKLLKEYLFESCGIVIPEEKSYLFRTRLNDVIEEEKFQSFNELYDSLESEKDGKLEKQIIEMMTTHETSFFRDTHPFQTFSTILLPESINRNKVESLNFTPSVSIWSAGCSTGQEPYSLAMIINDLQKSNPEKYNHTTYILASDISNQVLDQAVKGEYSQSEVERGLDENHRASYFQKKENRWQIDESIRKMITFREINLSKQLPDKIGSFDFIFCRNVIIYFSIELKKRLIDYYYNALKPGGILFIGASENLYKVTDKFNAEYVGPTTYYRVKK